MTLKHRWLALIGFIFAALCALVLLLSSSSFYLDENDHSLRGMNLANFILSDKEFGGGFSLVNQDGKPFQSNEYQEYYKLIYFGFTYCPTICPTSLNKITEALSLLEKEKAQKILPVFITVDPQRDTPEVIKPYVAAFHPRMVGLTGTPEQVNKVLERYRIFAQKVENGDPQEYMMNHTSFIFFAAPDDEVIGVFLPSQSAEDISHSVRNVMN